MNINKHGLSRNIPEPVKRDVRKRCFFGCVVCGSAIYDYEHFDPEFADAFKEKFTIKPCNINLYDDISISKLINKYPITPKEYIVFANHFIGAIYAEEPKSISWYPNKDFQYEAFLKAI